MKVKQSVEYEGKKIPLPFLIARETLNTDMTKVRNRFNGDETELPEFAVAVPSPHPWNCSLRGVGENRGSGAVRFWHLQTDEP